MAVKKFSSVRALVVLFLTLGIAGCDTMPTPNRAYRNCVNRTVLKLGGSKINRLSSFAKDLHLRIANQECQQAFQACQDDEGGRGCMKFLRKYSSSPKMPGKNA